MKAKGGAHGDKTFGRRVVRRSTEHLASKRRSHGFEKRQRDHRGPASAQQMTTMEWLSWDQHGWLRRGKWMSLCGVDQSV